MAEAARLSVIIEAQDQTRGVFSQVENNLQRLATGGQKTGAALGSIATTMAATGVVAGGALAAGVGKAVSVFADFESAMSQVKAASGATAPQMAQLSAAAIQFGSDITLAGIDATDAATAMTELAKGGVEVSQMADAAHGALLLASAGGISVAEATDTAVKAMTIFNLTGAEVGHVADVIAAGANKSATDVGQLNAAFNQSAAVAKDSGLSMEELTGTLALLAQSGLQGSDAGTALRTTLQRLTGPTDKAKELMEQLGISVFDASGKMRPFPDIVDNLKTAFAGLTDEQRGAALQTIAGADAVRVFLPLIRQGGGAVREWTAAVNEQGFAARTGAALNDNLAGSIDQLKATFQTAAIQVGSKFAPAVRQAADELGQFVQQAMASPEVTKFLEDLGTKGSEAITALVAKLKDPAFQQSLKEWGQAALDVGRSIVSLAGDIAGTLGPPLQAAVGWFNGLDEGAKKNVVTFGLVAAAAIGFRDELRTLLSVGDSVIDMFARKAAEKAKLTGANKTLADSAGNTATKMTAVRGAAAGAGAAIAEAAVVTGGAIAAWAGLIYVADKYNDASGTTARNERELITTRSALAIAAANGASAESDHAQAFLRLYAAQSQNITTTDQLVALWNQYVSTGAAAVGNTQGLTLALASQQQAIAGVTGRLGEGAIAGQAFNNTLAGLGSAAMALGNSLPPVGAALTAGALAMAALAPAATVATGPIGALALGFQDISVNGTSVQSALNDAGAAVIRAQQAFEGAIAGLQGLGSEAGMLTGLLRPLQAEWDQLNAATENGKHITADQQAAYDRLAPAIQYLNGKIGENKDNTVSASLAAVQNLQNVNNTATAYQGAASAAQTAAQAVQGAAQSTQTAATATHAAADAATIASIQYDEFGQAYNTAGNAAQASASAYQSAALATQASGAAASTAAGFFDGLTTAAQNVPTEVTIDTNATSAVTAAGQLAGLRIAAELVPKTTTTTSTADTVAAAGSIAGLTIAINSVPRSISIVASVDISGALGAINELRANMPSSPAEKGPFRAANFPDFGTVLDTFGEGISRAIGELPRLREAVDAETADLQKKIADATSAVAKAITDTLGAFRALSAFNPARDLPNTTQTSGFLGALSDFMERFATWAGGFEEDVLKSASQFADAAGKAVGIIADGVEGLGSLATFQAPLQSAVSYFLASLADFMEKFATVASGFEADVLEASSAFADGAGKAVGVVSDGVSGLMALADFTAPLESAVSAFLASLADFMERFSTTAGGFEADVLAVSSAFADATGKAVGVLGDAVTGLTALGDFAAPAQSAITAFLASLADFMERFSTAASGFERDVLAVASGFAESAGKVVGIIGNAVDGLSQLADFAAPSQAAIDNFVYAVYETVRKIAEMASQMSTEGIETAGAFGEAAGSIFSALKDALDIFTKLHDLVVPSAKAIDNFGIAVAYTVRRLGQFADEIGKDGLKQAQAFGQSVQSIFGSLKSAMDILTNLAKFKDEAAKAFDSLLTGMHAAIDRAQQMVSLSKDLVLEAEEYANNMRKASTLFAQGASFGGSPEKVGRSLGEGVANGARDALDSHSPSEVMAAIGRDVVAGLVQGMSESQQDAAKKAAEVASAIADAVAKGVAAFTALGRFAPPSASALYDFGKTLMAAVKDLAVVSETIAAELLDEAAKFGEIAQKAVGLYGSAISGFTSLVDYVRPAKERIFDFGKDLILAINDLAVVAEKVGAEVTAIAGRFGEDVGKATGGIANAVAGFAALGTYARIPEKAIYDFGKDIKALIKDFAVVVAVVGTAMIDEAAKLGENLGKVTGGIAAAVEGFTDLATFVTPAQSTVDGLIATIRYVIQRFGEMAATMATEGVEQTGKFGEATQKVLAGVHEAIQTFIDLDKAVVPKTGDLSDLVVAVQGVTRNMAAAAAQLGDKAIADAVAFGNAASAIFGALKAGLDLFVQIDKPGGWPVTDWLQPLVELMKGALARGGQLLSQAQQLKAIADQFGATLASASASFNAGGAMLAGGITGGSGGTVVVNNYTITGNTLLSKDTATQQQVAGIVTATAGRTIAYSASG